MGFDIRQDIFDTEGMFVEDEVESFIDELMRQFKASKEWQELRTEDKEDGEWSDLFLQMAFRYLGMPLYLITGSEMRTVLYEIIPAKVVMNPQDAPSLLRELRAFWGFLKREYSDSLPHAGSVLKVLNQKTIVQKVQQELANPTNHGLAKGVMMEAMQMGVDLTDDKAMEQFIAAYNEQIMQTLAQEIPESLQKKVDKITAIIDKVCDKHLNVEYAELGAEMTEELALLKPSPLERGREKSWAAAVVYALAKVNFMFDPSQTPHMKAADLAKLFKVSQQTASSKAGDILDMLDIIPMDPSWTLPSQLNDNPLIWMLMVNGMPIDIRLAPREAQVEAYNQGLIPYIPADQPDGDTEAKIIKPDFKAGTKSSDK